MNKISKKKIAQDFINHHKQSIIDNWRADLLDTYNNIRNDEYGECRHLQDGIFEIEISGSDRPNGNPFLFTFGVGI